MTCKFEVHFQGNCQDSQVTHFHSFQLFWYMLLPEFVSWEGTPFAFSSDTVAASGLHYSKSHLLEVHLDSFCDFTSTRKEGPACLKYMLAVVTVNTPSTRGSRICWTSATLPCSSFLGNSTMVSSSSSKWSCLPPESTQKYQHILHPSSLPSLGCILLRTVTSHHLTGRLTPDVFPSSFLKRSSLLDIGALAV